MGFCEEDRSGLSMNFLTLFINGQGNVDIGSVRVVYLANHNFFDDEV